MDIVKSTGKDSSDLPKAGLFPSRIPEGKYDAFCYATEKGRSWGYRESIYVKFRLIGGKYDETEIFMVCTFQERSEINHRHKYFQQFSIANGGPPEKGQKLSPKIFLNKSFRVLVRDTKRKFSNKEPMPSFMQYSVVDTILNEVTDLPF